MKLIAHRGLKTQKVKANTIPAFLNAIENSEIAGFEFDVRQTKDGIFIVNHNSFIKNDIIKYHTYKELRAKYNITTLKEVLKLKTNKILLIEIKDFNIDFERFIKILKNSKNQNIYLMSFHNKVIHTLKKFQSNFKLGILNYVLNTEENYPYDFICLLNNLVTKQIIQNYQKKNIEVFLYGVLNEDKDLIYSNSFYIVDRVPTNYIEKKNVL